MKIVNGTKMFTTDELKELLGISTATIANMRRKGILPSTRIGRTIYTSEECLRDYLNAKTRPTENKPEK